MRTPRCAGRRRDSGWVRFVVAVGISPALFASACSSSTQSRSQSSSTKAESRTTSTTHTRTKHPFRCKGTGAATFDAKTKSFVGDWTHATCTHLGVTRHPFKVTPGSNDRSFTLTGANGDTPSGTSTETTTPGRPEHAQGHRPPHRHRRDRAPRRRDRKLEVDRHDDLPPRHSSALQDRLHHRGDDQLLTRSARKPAFVSHEHLSRKTGDMSQSAVHPACQRERMGAQDAVMVALTLSSTDISDLTMM